MNFHLHNWKLLIKLSIISEVLIEFLELPFTVCCAQCECGLDASQIDLVVVVVLCRCPAHRCRARGVGPGGRGSEGRKEHPGRAAGVQGSGARDQRGTPDTNIHLWLTEHRAAAELGQTAVPYCAEKAWKRCCISSWGSIRALLRGYEECNWILSGLCSIICIICCIVFYLLHVPFNKSIGITFLVSHRPRVNNSQMPFCCLKNQQIIKHLWLAQEHRVEFCFHLLLVKRKGPLPF